MTEQEKKEAAAKKAAEKLADAAATAKETAADAKEAEQAAALAAINASGEEAPAPPVIIYPADEILQMPKEYTSFEDGKVFVSKSGESKKSKKKED